MAVWLVGYLLLFGMLTVQDRLSGPQAVPYTEFKIQVGNKNVAELFARGDSIEGQLKKAAPISARRIAAISNSRPNARHSQMTTCWPS
jgi:cell division protease FtsH